MSLKRLVPALLVLALSAPVATRAQSPKDSPDVTRATLKNGLRVVLIRNRLAPVVTVEANYMVGGDETPEGFPGTAHALEHMAFRGCTGMTADQTAAIYAQLGGENNADTQQNITQFFATVPAADLDVALEAQAKCMLGVDNTEAEWDKERGAIEQEVSRDLSNPTYKFIARLNEDMFAGTPYAHDPLGTRPSFDKTTGKMLGDFYKAWYVPSNAILIVVGDFEPAAAMAKVKALYETVPDHKVAEHPVINLQPVKPESFTLDSNLPYVLGFISYRLPGTDSPDFAAANILADVLASQRADVYAMVPAGKALAAEFAMEETYPKASVGFGLVAQPAGVDPKPALDELKKILDTYAKNGVPSELVDAAKRAELAQAQFQRNSIPGLATVWSSALAAEGRNSPDEDIDAIRKVTLDDVNRVAKEYLLNAPVITATLVPKPTGETASAKGFGGAESVTQAPTKPVVLPEWAATKLDELKVPSTPLDVSDTTLANGIRLIVRTDRTSPTVTLVGGVKHNADLQTPAGKDGADALLDELYSYGTTSLDRIAYQKALDDIAANASAGYHFSLTSLKENFARGVELLADDELHPALPPQAFAVVQQQTAEFTAGNIQSPGYKFDHALQRALLPANDPQLRDATPETIKSVTLADVKALHDATLRPDLTTIVVIGDITPAEARASIEKYFGAWKATGPKPETDLGPVPVNKASATNVADAEQVQDTVVLAEQLSLNRFSPDYYPLQLGTHVLGGGFYATRLYHDLRQVAGYVYSVDVALSAGKTRASYEVEYGSDPDKVSKARALVERDLKQMATEEVSPAELHQAKALLLRQIPLGESSEEAVAGGLLARAQIGLPLDESVRSAKIYAGLTAAQIKAAFARYVDTGVLVQVVRGPAPQ
ncbi:zinc protease [Bryocella elongata]|uniref:Zinc protease n=1 Tax=Bryocella elongata TaxID=863522 RepID=A0A1H6A3H4_9BACT|nr:pitrilysin family protein [Bryocella elongata]SEG42991.1 zinc protease [Bryocella elongata]